MPTAVEILSGVQRAAASATRSSAVFRLTNSMRAAFAVLLVTLIVVCGGTALFILGYNIIVMLNN